MTPAQRERFLNLACQLSPENLYEDGQISGAVADRKARLLQREWHQLEREVGRTVTDHEIWQTVALPIHE